MKKLLSLIGFSLMLCLFSVPVKATSGDIDTLMPDIIKSNIPLIYAYSAPYIIGYKATVFNPVAPCSIKAIWHGLKIWGTCSKNCSLFIWNDSSGTPGARLFSVAVAETGVAPGLVVTKSGLITTTTSGVVRRSDADYTLIDTTSLTFTNISDSTGKYRANILELGVDSVLSMVQTDTTDYSNRILAINAAPDSLEANNVLVAIVITNHTTIDTLINSISNSYTINKYTLPSPIYVSDSFWVGSYEPNGLFPTTAVYKEKRNSYSNNGTIWYSDNRNYDYYHVVITKEQ